MLASTIAVIIQVYKCTKFQTDLIIFSLQRILGFSDGVLKGPSTNFSSLSYMKEVNML